MRELERSNMRVEVIGMGPKMGRERLARYSLTGPENQAAVDAGLAGGDWFRSAVPRKRMKELMKRSDYPAVRDTAIWIGLILLFAGLGITFWTVWHSWWAVPFFLAYGLLYGSTSDSRWHESGHGTAFKTRWMDEGLYQIASFMIMRDPTTWRWSHTRHHTDTLVVGRDPEIAVMRPARLVRLLANLIGLVDVPMAFWLMFVHASGRLTAEYLREYNVPFIAAGRNKEKIQDVMNHVPGIETADYEVVKVGSSMDELTKLFAGAKVVCNTVGPFIYYGPTVVEACLKAGCHYLDISGEQAWHRELAEKWSDKFAAKGLAIVAAMAFMSAPSDAAARVCLEH